jgi:hypothetical protein
MPRKMWLLGILLLIPAGCRNLIGPTFEQALKVEFRLSDGKNKQQKEFRCGDDIHFYYKVENTSAQARDYYVPDTGPIVRFEVRKDGVLLGTSDDGFGYAEVIVDGVLEAGKSLTHSYNWRLTDLHEPLLPGKYTALAVARLQFEEIAAPLPREIRFEVFCDSTRVVHITDAPVDSIELDAFRLNSADIKGRYLVMAVTHGGGCMDHEYELFMSPAAFMESFPVQAALYLRHNGNNDPCDAVLKQDLIFDVSEIVELYKRQYGRTDNIILNIFDYTKNMSPNNIKVTYVPGG